ncbi:MAG: hypothetical protein ACKV2T_35565 [Kofleriaceae bacterium]
MHWLAVLAYAAVTRKLIQRYRRGLDVDVILADPEHVRTLVQFELADPAHARALLAAIAEALALDGWVVEDHARSVDRPRTELAIRARKGERELDVVRLVAGDRYTLELTRAWTGADLGAPTRAMLIRIHDVLAGDPRVLRLGWHQRQDRALAIPHAAPVAM